MRAATGGQADMPRNDVLHTFLYASDANPRGGLFAAMPVFPDLQPAQIGNELLVFDLDVFEPPIAKKLQHFARRKRHQLQLDIVHALDHGIMQRLVVGSVCISNLFKPILFMLEMSPGMLGQEADQSLGGEARFSALHGQVELIDVFEDLLVFRV